VAVGTYSLFISLESLFPARETAAYLICFNLICASYLNIKGKEKVRFLVINIYETLKSKK